MTALGLAWYNEDMKAKDHPLHRTYEGMIERCYYPKSKRYHRYGGRGIRVCDRWARRPDKKATGFWNFVEDMGLKPDPTYTLDRVENDGPYSPENCRWASVETQALNKDQARGERVGGAKLTTSAVVEIKRRLAEGHSVVEIARENGVTDSAIRDIKLGKSWTHVT